MQEIRKRNCTVFLVELFWSWNLLLVGLGAIALALSGGSIPAMILGGALASLGVARAHKSSVPKRFYQRRYLALWQGVDRRLGLFRDALKSMRKQKVAQLEDLPVTIESVARQLYLTLRRADCVANELAQSEGWLIAQPGTFVNPPRDVQAQELYRMADRNIAEYRLHFQAIMASVERAEAQSAVLSTTLDTLRMKMLGHRYAGREVEAASSEFMAAITEAKMQLDAIDKTLAELEMTPFPTTVTIIPDASAASTPPPPMPSSPTTEQGQEDRA